MSQGSQPPRGFRVVDEGSLHKYRTEIPNTIVKGMMGRDLTLPARWLYVYLKSVTGDSGECWQNTGTLARGARLGRGTVSTAKDELVKAGLIKITSREGNLTDLIRLIDIWEQNFAEFGQSSRSALCAETNSLVPLPGDEPSGAQHVVPSEDATRALLTKLATALASAPSLKANPVRSAETQELLTTISSLLLKAEGQDSSISDFSANAAMTTNTLADPARCSRGEHLNNSLIEDETNEFSQRCSGGEQGVQEVNKVFITRTQCSGGEQGVQEVNERRSLQEDLLKKEENYSLPSVGSLHGAVSDASTPCPPADISQGALAAKPKPAPKIKPLAEGDWLRTVLESYPHTIDFDALNDDGWWIDVSQPLEAVFAHNWLNAECGLISAYLRENKAKRPASPSGWKRFVRSWLMRSFEKQRRNTRGSTAQRPPQPYRESD